MPESPPKGSALPGPPASGVDSLVAELLVEGQAVEDGAFSVDRDAARAKIRAFQIADPLRYVVELLSVAVRSGATWIEVRADADDFVLRFDGRPLEREDAEELWASLLVHAESETLARRRALALGLNTALALPPRWIRVRSAAPGRPTLRVELRPGQDEVVETVEASDADPVGTEVHVKRPFGLGLVSRALQDRRGALPEERILREEAPFCRVPVTLEGEELPRGYPGRLEALTVTDQEALGLRGYQGFDLQHLGPAVVHLVAGGIRVAQHALEGPQGFVAVVACDALRRDLSAQDVVRDATYEAVLDEVRRRRDAALAALVEPFRAGTLEPMERWIPVLRDASLGLEAAGHTLPEALVATLCEAPLWHLVLKGGRVSDPFRSMSGDAQGPVWVVGEKGLSMRRTLSSFRTVETHTKLTLRGVWHHSPAFAVAVGEAGKVLFWERGAWRPKPFPERKQLEAVSGRAPDDFVVLGESETLYRWDGAEWHLMTEVDGNFWEAVWMAPSGEIFAGGSDGLFLHDARGWRRLGFRSSDWLRGVHGCAPDCVWAVGEDGLVLHWDGRRCHTVPVGASEDLACVHVTRPDDVWVGGKNVLLHFDGAAWRRADLERLGAPWFFACWAGPGPQCFFGGIHRNELAAAALSEGRLKVSSTSPRMAEKDQICSLAQLAEDEVARTASIVVGSEAPQGHPYVEVSDEREAERLRRVLGRAGEKASSGPVAT